MGRSGYKGFDFYKISAKLVIPVFTLLVVGLIKKRRYQGKGHYGP
jgi:hypothetical protein